MNFDYTQRTLHSGFANMLAAAAVIVELWAELVPVAVVHIVVAVPVGVGSEHSVRTAVAEKIVRVKMIVEVVNDVVEAIVTTGIVVSFVRFQWDTLALHYPSLG